MRNRSRGSAAARVFTLSGNHIMSIFDAALEADLDLVHVRHEAAAVHMADAYGRLTGEAGIALVTGGPGHANAVGALFTALGAESPMVLLSGHAATWELGRGGFQEIRQAEMAAPVTKASWTATLRGNARATISARRSASPRPGGPGPVHLSLPSDLLEERVESNAIVWPDRRSDRRDGARARSGGRRCDSRRDRRLPSGRSSSPARSCRTSAAARCCNRLEAATGAPAVIMESPRGIADATLGAFADLVASRRPDRAARQGARLHHADGRRARRSIRTCASSRSIREAALVERAAKEKGERLLLGCIADIRTAAETLIARAAMARTRDGPIG